MDAGTIEPAQTTAVWPTGTVVAGVGSIDVMITVYDSYDNEVACSATLASNFVAAARMGTTGTLVSAGPSVCSGSQFVLTLPAPTVVGVYTTSATYSGTPIKDWGTTTFTVTAGLTGCLVFAATRG